MAYLNKNFLDSVNKNPKYKNAIEVMKKEAEEFASTFKDNPADQSEWGHYYFCNIDGGRLIWDINKPKQHKCEVCGKEFTDEVYNGVWTYFYRNQAILCAWKAAAVYQVTKDQKHLDIIKKIIGFYADNYTKFSIHNKEHGVFESYETMKWGSARILPQGLNESIISIRMIQTLELVKDVIGKDFLNDVYNKMFKEIYLLLKPQVDQIHNIRCWKNSAIGCIGLFFGDKEMVDFVFNGEYNIRKQIQKGVTVDNFWYEGSIHYNFFTLEGISALLLFSELYGYDFGKEEKKTVENMFIAAYNYAFDNQFFPNPNDGWPSINLKTYSYIYNTATKVFGEDSVVGNLLKNIENHDLPRGTLPLSKPYYINNEISIERLLLNTDLDLSKYTVVKPTTQNYEGSQFAMLRNDNMNVFVKYGMNGPSHSHPDLINIEVMHQDDLISRDISNAGYQAKLCKEWHRKSLCHNTIIMNGKDVESTARGKTISYTKDSIVCQAPNAYEGVDYQRSVKLTENGFTDLYEVSAKKEATFDFIFHLEADLEYVGKLSLEDSTLGFNENGYEHVLDVKKIATNGKSITVNFKKGNKTIDLDVNVEGKEAFLLKTMDNPVNRTRTSILLREKGTKIKYEMEMKING